MRHFIKSKYKESVWLLKNKGFYGFLKAFQEFIIRESSLLMYSRKPDKEYFLLQKKLRKKRENKNKLNRIAATMNAQSLFSVILLLDDTDWWVTELCLQSILNQNHPKFELIIADYSGDNELSFRVKDLIKGDKSINYKQFSKNTSKAGTLRQLIGEAGGDYILLLKSGDQLEKTSLLYFADKINKTGADIVYADEDQTDGKGNYHTPLFKPDYSPQLLYSYNYIQHAIVFSKSFADRLRWDLRPEHDDSLLYYITLQITELAEHIAHIPDILLHQYVSIENAGFNNYLNYNKESGLETLKLFFRNSGLRIKISHGYINGTYLSTPVISDFEKISIVIPFKDRIDLLKQCIQSIIHHTTYPDYEIILVSNNSKEKETFCYLNKITTENDNIRFLEWNHEFNYSEINNIAVKKATGNLILFLNNDIEVISSGWLTSLASQIQYKNVAAVGAKLLYPNKTVQHAGIIIGIGGCADHVFKFHEDDDNGYMLRANVINNFSALTAACLLIKKQDFIESGGLDTENLKISFNDVDLCMKIRQSEKLIVYHPYVKLTHHESVSRGKDFETIHSERHFAEVNFLRQKWNIDENPDPFYNVNLSLINREFEINQWYLIR